MNIYGGLARRQEVTMREVELLKGKGNTAHYVPLLKFLEKSRVIAETLLQPSRISQIAFSINSSILGDEDDDDEGS